MTTSHPYPRQMQYQITPADYSALRTRLSAATPEEGCAGTVHTLLFASYRNRVPSHPMWAFQAPDQAEPRFTLRYFDNDPTYLRLDRRLEHECTSAMVTEAECRALLSGETDWLLERHNPLLQDFHDSLTQQMLLPQLLLSYHREIYSLDDLDLWVAFNSDIHASLQHCYSPLPSQPQTSFIQSHHSSSPKIERAKQNKTKPRTPKCSSYQVKPSLVSSQKLFEFSNCLGRITGTFTPEQDENWESWLWGALCSVSSTSGEQGARTRTRKNASC